VGWGGESRYNRLVTKLPSNLRQYHHRQRDLQVRIKRSRRKTLAIHILQTLQVEVRAPLHCPVSEIDRFLDMRLDWIVSSLEHMASHPPTPAPTFCDGEWHDYLGEPHQLQLVRGKPETVLLGTGSLLVRCAAPSDGEQVQRLLERFWRQRAPDIFQQQIGASQQRFALTPAVGKLRVRKMTARWGSCSRAGDICLNSLLVQKAPVAIDLVVTHELCHLSHFAHNKAFYGLMDTVMPTWREHEALLNQPSWRTVC
jgi:predicted metal-dependent hydrolase